MIQFGTIPLTIQTSPIAGPFTDTDGFTVFWVSELQQVPNAPEQTSSAAATLLPSTLGNRESIAGVMMGVACPVVHVFPARGHEVCAAPADDCRLTDDFPDRSVTTAGHSIADPGGSSGRIVLSGKLSDIAKSPEPPAGDAEPACPTAEERYMGHRPSADSAPCLMSVAGIVRQKPKINAQNRPILHGGTESAGSTGQPDKGEGPQVASRDDRPARLDDAGYALAMPPVALAVSAGNRAPSAGEGDQTDPLWAAPFRRDKVQEAGPTIQAGKEPAPSERAKEEKCETAPVVTSPDHALPVKGPDGSVHPAAADEMVARSRREEDLQPFPDADRTGSDQIAALVRFQSSHADSQKDPNGAGSPVAMTTDTVAIASSAEVPAASGFPDRPPATTMPAPSAVSLEANRAHHHVPQVKVPLVQRFDGVSIPSGFATPPAWGHSDRSAEDTLPIAPHPSEETAPESPVHGEVAGVESPSENPGLAEPALPETTGLATERQAEGTASTPSLTAPQPPQAPAQSTYTPQTLSFTAPEAIAQVMVERLAVGSDGALELTLSPQELGPLRIELSATAEGLRVTLSAERPEAMDLLRRHAGELLAELRQAGWAQASLGFGQWGQGRNGSGQGAADRAGHRIAEAPPESRSFAPPRHVTAQGGLNLRL